jgi:hypothetical protein
MCNVSNADAVTLAHRVADAVVGGGFPQPVPVAAARASAQQAGSSVTLADAERSSLAGRYYSDELSATYDLGVADGVLVLRRGRAAPDTLRAVDHQTLRAGSITLHFDAASAARASNFTVENGRARGIEFVRVARSDK